MPVCFLSLARTIEDENALRNSLEHVGSSGVSLSVLYQAAGIAIGYNSLERELLPEANQILCFLHTDTILHFDWATVIPKYFATLPNVGIVGFVGTSRLTIDGRWWLAGPLYGSLIQGYCNVENMNYGDVDKYQEVASVDGYCLFIQRNVFREIGRFDESIDGWHFYDADLCTTVREHGYRNYVIQARSQHISNGVLNEDWARCQSLFQKKWQGVLRQ